MTTQLQKKQKLKHAVQNNLYMLRMIHEICPKLVPLSFLVSFAGFFMWAFSTIVFTQYIFGSADMDKTFSEVLLFLMVYAALNLVTDLLQGWFYQRYRPMHEPEIYYKMHLKLFEKANNADVGCFENAEYFDSYTKAANEAAQRAMSVVHNCSTAVSALLSFLYVTYVMFTINVFIGLTAFIPIINHLFISTRVKKLEYDRKMEQIPTSGDRRIPTGCFICSNMPKNCGSPVFPTFYSRNSIIPPVLLSASFALIKNGWRC